MDLATLTQKANEAVTAGSDFNKKVKFDFGDVGKLFIDGANGTADNSDGDADATVKVDWEDFKKLASGDMDPTMAFMQGKLKVLGDMSVAMQLQSLMKKLA
ncbi:SCP2 sterol-binding domain-containing protein [Henriciella aquimarina]|uniref:SCP2 sterol-binding domain-containing protein n=1 Tax=Henriciella aquimarina TaxID=545261 RepID=UPI000A02D967|nr:SCP2 sterol-binding domain-containing protein [Henriciella aquimarina]